MLFGETHELGGLGVLRSGWGLWQVGWTTKSISLGYINEEWMVKYVVDFYVKCVQKKKHQINKSIKLLNKCFLCSNVIFSLSLWLLWKYLDLRLEVMVMGVLRKGSGRAEGEGLGLGLRADLELEEATWKRLEQQMKTKTTIKVFTFEMWYNFDIICSLVWWGGLWCCTFA